MQTVELDQERAASVNELQASVTTTADEPLIVTVTPAATPGKHWIVEHAALVANLATRAPADSRGMAPLSGLFLITPGSPSESEAQAEVGWVPAARGFPLPLSDPLINFATIGATGPPFPIALVLCAGFKITVPYGWAIRGIVTCQQGGLTPGPGAGSTGTLRLLCRLEQDDPCAPA